MNANISVGYDRQGRGLSGFAVGFRLW